MDLKTLKNIRDAYLDVIEEKKKLSPAQQKELDVDDDMDIDADDFAKLRKKKGKEQKEETKKLDELSPATKKKYTKAASKDLAARSMQHGKDMSIDQYYDGGARASTGRSKNADKIRNRMRGINRATKEEVEQVERVSESVGMRRALEQVWLEAAEKHTKGATKPEQIMDKESPKSKEFAAKHKYGGDKNDLVTDYDEKGHDDATKAGRATKQAAARNGDQLNVGDKKIVK